MEGWSWQAGEGTEAMGKVVMQLCAWRGVKLEMGGDQTIESRGVWKSTSEYTLAFYIGVYF
jgi:hypothetical protein